MRMPCLRRGIGDGAQQTLCPTRQIVPEHGACHAMGHGHLWFKSRWVALRYAGTPLQFCGPSISTDLFLCTFSLQNSSRQGDEGPWVWLAYREERCLFSTHIVAPCFLTCLRRVHSETFEGGIDAPRFLVSECCIGNQFDRVMSARDTGTRYKLV